jgi:hypothetical protein
MWRQPPRLSRVGEAQRALRRILRDDIGRSAVPQKDHTIPFRNSSSGYFVPRQTMPSFHSVCTIDRSSV